MCQGLLDRFRRGVWRLGGESHAVCLEFLLVRNDRGGRFKDIYLVYMNRKLLFLMPEQLEKVCAIEIKSAPDVCSTYLIEIYHFYKFPFPTSHIGTK